MISEEPASCHRRPRVREVFDEGGKFGLDVAVGSLRRVQRAICCHARLSKG
jgi:spore maturation protein SpmB